MLDGFMIDAPVYKQVRFERSLQSSLELPLIFDVQAQKVLVKARAAGMEIPTITEDDI